MSIWRSAIPYVALVSLVVSCSTLPKLGTAKIESTTFASYDPEGLPAKKPVVHANSERGLKTCNGKVSETRH